jgi:hypothetical protein
MNDNMTQLANCFDYTTNRLYANRFDAASQFIRNTEFSDEERQKAYDFVNEKLLEYVTKISHKPVSERYLGRIDDTLGALQSYINPEFVPQRTSLVDVVQDSYNYKQSSGKNGALPQGFQLVYTPLSAPPQEPIKSATIGYSASDISDKVNDLKPGDAIVVPYSVLSEEQQGPSLYEKIRNYLHCNKTDKADASNQEPGFFRKLAKPFVYATSVLMLASMLTMGSCGKTGEHIAPPMPEAKVAKTLEAKSLENRMEGLRFNQATAITPDYNQILESRPAINYAGMNDVGKQWFGASYDRKTHKVMLSKDFPDKEKMMGIAYFNKGEKKMLFEIGQPLPKHPSQIVIGPNMWIKAACDNPNGDVYVSLKLKKHVKHKQQSPPTYRFDKDDGKDKETQKVVVENPLEGFGGNDARVN